MKLHIDDRFITLVFDTVEEESVVKDNFTYDDMSAVFLGGSFDKRKIKRKCFIKTKKQYHFLGSGFLKELITLIKQQKFQVSELIDSRTKFPYQLEKWENQDLSKFFSSKFQYINHQLECLKKMMKTNVGIIEAPTASGKSETIIAFIKATKLPTLIVVNRVSLAIQLADRLCENGIQAIPIHGKTSAYKPATVMVATIGSVMKVSALASVKLLILDEVHHAQAKSYQDFLKTTAFPIRFGFSATPTSGDKYKFALIKQYMGDIIHTVDVKELIDNEVIAKPKIEFIKSVGTPNTNWVSSYIYSIVLNSNRNKIIKELVEKHNLQSLILIRIIQHGKELAKLMPDAVFVSGIDDAEYRKEIIAKFEKGEIKTLISSNIFNEGISINAIKLLIIASGGKSKIETIQKLGRGLRIRPDKNEVLVYDFDDNGNIYTERHSNMRKGIYERAGFEVLDK